MPKFKKQAKNFAPVVEEIKPQNNDNENYPKKDTPPKQVAEISSPPANMLREYLIDILLNLKKLNSSIALLLPHKVFCKDCQCATKIHGQFLLVCRRRPTDEQCSDEDFCYDGIPKLK